MQRAIFQQATIRHIQSQASRVVPAGTQDRAINDDSYHGEVSLLRLVFSVLANVVGGSLLLYGMFVLPHVLGEILS
jgi:hypothetical protein